LVDSPAVIIDADQMTASMRRIMRGMKKDFPATAGQTESRDQSSAQHHHSPGKKIRSSDAAGGQGRGASSWTTLASPPDCLDDPRTMLLRLNELLETVLSK